VRFQAAKEHLEKIGLSASSWTNISIAAEALERNITVERRENSRFLYLADGSGKKFRWFAGNNNLNSRLAVRIAKHKQAASALLRAYGAPALENAAFTPDEADRAWEWASSFEASVLKPTNGRQGENVHVGIRTREEFIQAFTSIASETNSDVLVEEFSQGSEHRCLVVKNKFIAATRRRPASVLGDGTLSIRELIDKKNDDRGRIHKQIKLDTMELRELSRLGYSPDSIPKDGERVYLRATTNIHTGGDAIDATDDVTPEEIARIEETARKIPGAAVIGMDVLLPRAEGDHDLRVIELNLSPMISMHHFPWEGAPRDAAGAVLDAMFPGSGAAKSVSTK